MNDTSNPSQSTTVIGVPSPSLNEEPLSLSDPLVQRISRRLLAVNSQIDCPLSWHSTAHYERRGAMRKCIARILSRSMPVLGISRSNQTSTTEVHPHSSAHNVLMEEKLLRMGELIEQRLYYSSSSMDKYQDISTLVMRIKRMVAEIVQETQRPVEIESHKQVDIEKQEYVKRDNLPAAKPQQVQLTVTESVATKQISSVGCSRMFIIKVLERMHKYLLITKASTVFSIPRDAVQQWLDDVREELTQSPSDNIFGGTPFSLSDSSTHWTEAGQLHTWWRNSIDRKLKLKVLQEDAQYSGNDVKKLQRAKWCTEVVNAVNAIRSILLVQADEAPMSISSQAPPSLPQDNTSPFPQHPPESTIPAISTQAPIQTMLGLPSGFANQHSFVSSLHDMIDAAGQSASWKADGLSFSLVDPVSFARDVLPNFFPHMDLTSFFVMLRIHGFEHSSTPRGIEFRNALFMRGRRDLAVYLSLSPHLHAALTVQQVLQSLCLPMPLLSPLNLFAQQHAQNQAAQHAPERMSAAMSLAQGSMCDPWAALCVSLGLGVPSFASVAHPPGGSAAPVPSPGIPPTSSLSSGLLGSVLPGLGLILPELSAMGPSVPAMGSVPLNMGQSLGQTMGVNLPTPGVSMPTPGLSIPFLGANLSTPGTNISTLGANISTPEANMPTLGASIPTPGSNFSTLGATMPTLGADFSTLGVNIPTPEANLSTLGANLPTLGKSLSTPVSTISLVGFNAAVAGASSLRPSTPPAVFNVSQSLRAAPSPAVSFSWPFSPATRTVLDAGASLHPAALSQARTAAMLQSGALAHDAAALAFRREPVSARRKGVFDPNPDPEGVEVGSTPSTAAVSGDRALEEATERFAREHKSRERARERAIEKKRERERNVLIPKHPDSERETEKEKDSQREGERESGSESLHSTDVDDTLIVRSQTKSPLNALSQEGVGAVRKRRGRPARERESDKQRDKDRDTERETKKVRKSEREGETEKEREREGETEELDLRVARSLSVSRSRRTRRVFLDLSQPALTTPSDESAVSLTHTAYTVLHGKYTCGAPHNAVTQPHTAGESVVCDTEPSLSHTQSGAVSVWRRGRVSQHDASSERLSAVSQHAAPARAARAQRESDVRDRETHTCSRVGAQYQAVIVTQRCVEKSPREALSESAVWSPQKMRTTHVSEDALCVMLERMRCVWCVPTLSVGAFVWAVLSERESRLCCVVRVDEKKSSSKVVSVYDGAMEHVVSEHALSTPISFPEDEVLEALQLNDFDMDETMNSFIAKYSTLFSLLDERTRWPSNEVKRFCTACRRYDEDILAIYRERAEQTHVHNPQRPLRELVEFFQFFHTQIATRRSVELVQLFRRAEKALRERDEDAVTQDSEAPPLARRRGRPTRRSLPAPSERETERERETLALSVSHTWPSVKTRVPLTHDLLSKHTQQLTQLTHSVTHISPSPTDDTHTQPGTVSTQHTEPSSHTEHETPIILHTQPQPTQPRRITLTRMYTQSTQPTQPTQLTTQNTTQQFAELAPGSLVATEGHFGFLSFYDPLAFTDRRRSGTRNGSMAKKEPLRRLCMCQKELEFGERYIRCVSGRVCGGWVHLWCAGLHRTDYERLKENRDFVCQECEESEIEESESKEEEEKPMLKRGRRRTM